MLGRVLDAIAMRCAPQIEAAVDRAIEAKDAQRRKDVRELISEMEDVLEKFSRVVAREAKRRARDMKEELEQPATVEPTQPNLEELPAAERKRLLRARIAAGGMELHSGMARPER